MSGPVVIPVIYTLPFAFALLLAVALNWRDNLRADVPASRRRIRQANAGVMFLTVPLLIAGASVVNPFVSPREWVLIWLANLGLLLISIGLAMLDAMNTIRLSRREGRGKSLSIEDLAADVLASRAAEMLRGVSPRAE